MFIPAYAISSLLAFVAIFGLGGVTLLAGNHDRTGVTFALFCLSWALFAGAALTVQTLGSPILGGSMERALVVARVAPAFVLLTLYSAMHYVLALTGYHAQPRRKILFFSIRSYVWVYSVALVLGLTFGVGSELVVSGLRFDPLFGYTVEFKLTALLVQIPVGMLDMVGIVLLVQRLGEVEPSAYRTFLKHNLVGLLVIKLGTAISLLILPHVGVPGFVVSFHLFALVAFFFFYAVNRFQTRQIQELNAGLERTVERRTAQLRQAQARLVQSEKMVAMGRLVAGLAHELNTPLGAVRSMQDTRVRAEQKLAGLVQQREGGDQRRVQRTLGAIAEADRVMDEGLSRIEQTVTRLRRFAHLDEADLQRVDLNEELRQTVALFEPQLAPEVTLKLHLSPLPRLLCDPRQLNQVVTHLLQNAAQASEGGGVVELRSEAADGAVRIVVRDRGCGIPADALERVFEPGYTTRGVGVGTGLGLAIAYQIVRDHGGEIGLQSAPGQGTTATVTLPLRSEPSPG